MGRLKYSIKDCQKYAQKHEGRCLSKTYPPRKVLWKCREGHRWSSNFSVVLWRKSWCPICSAKTAGLAKKLTLQDAQKVAQKKGGRLISKAYTYSKRPYLWECANGHQWKSSFDKIRNTRSWCPYCSGGSGEECVRICFQRIFRRKFPKKRPDWLVVGSRSRLELDGYNARMGVAFEHQGRMHYLHIRHFHGTRKNFAKRVALDRLKNRLCTQHGVRLVKIPEVGWKFTLERLLPEVIRRCRKQGIRVPVGADRLRINYAPAMNMNPDKSVECLKLLAAHARKRGGHLLDKEWHGRKWKHRFKCQRGHIFRTTIGNLIGLERWCNLCSLVTRRHRKKDWWNRYRETFSDKLRKKRSYRLRELQDIAKKRGGRCLSVEWDKVNTRYKFECGTCGRVWMTTALHIIQGQWCRICASRKARRIQLRQTETEDN